MPNFEHSKVGIPGCSEEIGSPTKNEVIWTERTFVYDDGEAPK
jgi:hypothetical protein